MIKNQKKLLILLGLLGVALNLLLKLLVACKILKVFNVDLLIGWFSRRNAFDELSNFLNHLREFYHPGSLKVLENCIWLLVLGALAVVVWQVTNELSLYANAMLSKKRAAELGKTGQTDGMLLNGSSSDMAAGETGGSIANNAGGVVRGASNNSLMPNQDNANTSANPNNAMSAALNTPHNVVSNQVTSKQNQSFWQLKLSILVCFGMVAAGLSIRILCAAGVLKVLNLELLAGHLVGRDFLRQMNLVLDNLQGFYQNDQINIIVYGLYLGGLLAGIYILMSLVDKMQGRFELSGVEQVGNVLYL